MADQTARPLRIGIAGALGRMGRTVATLLADRPGATVAAAFDRPETTGQRAGDLALTTLGAALPLCDVVIDFSTSAASADLATVAAAAGRPGLVIGSTGWTGSEEHTLQGAAQRIAIVRAGNFSLGVNMLAGLVERAARELPADAWDVEVFEAHHRRKVDAPSGTALMLGEAVARGRQVELGQRRLPARDGITGPRPEGAIGFSVMRGGGLVGEHQVAFIADDETLTFSHSARDRSLFARGALAAAAWVVRQPPGLYDMMDVLGFRN